jgi:hypothetical protein
VVKRCHDRVLTGGTSGRGLRVKTRLLEKLPHSCHARHVWCRGWSGPSRHPPGVRPRWCQRPPLLAHLVQDAGDRDAWRGTSPPASALTPRFRRHIRQMLAGEECRRAGVPGGQPMHPLAFRRRGAKPSGNTPPHRPSGGHPHLGGSPTADGARARLRCRSPRRHGGGGQASWAATAAGAGRTPPRRGRLPRRVNKCRPGVGWGVIPVKASILAAASAMVAGGRG